MLRERNIATCVLLTIFTCGIYGIVWFIQLTDDVQFASGDREMSGLTAFLLSIITCQIYGFYWSYKMGKSLQVAKQNRDLPADDNSVLYLILHIFGFGLVNYCLMQNELNNLARTDVK